MVEKMWFPRKDLGPLNSKREKGCQASNNRYSIDQMLYIIIIVVINIAKVFSNWKEL